MYALWVEKMENVEGEETDPGPVYWHGEAARRWETPQSMASTPIVMAICCSCQNGTVPSHTRRETQAQFGGWHPP